MIQSISYNLTDEESTLLKVSAQKFKECSFFESLSIRSLIDLGASEYKLNWHELPKTKYAEKARFKKSGINYYILYPLFVIV